MKLVIMTKSTFFVEEDKILATLFDEGMDSLHLYKPDSSPMYSERLLTLLPEDYYRKITVHEHFYLKSEYNLGGIHIDRPEEVVPKGYKGQVSRTCTDIEMLKPMVLPYGLVVMDAHEFDLDIMVLAIYIGISVMGNVVLQLPKVNIASQKVQGVR